MEKWFRLLMAGLLPFVWMSCRSTASVGTAKAPSEAEVALDDDDNDDSTDDTAAAEKEKDAEIARKAWELYRNGASIDVIMASASGKTNRNRQISNEKISYQNLYKNIEMGNAWGIEEMIRAGMDLNEPDSHGSLSMQYAMKGSVDVIRRM